MRPSDPVEEIRHCAEVSVSRGCAFAALGILTLGVGLSFEPVIATRAAAILSAIMALVLWRMARRAPTRRYRSTEVWAMLDRRRRLGEEETRRAILGALRDSYLRYARFTAYATAGLWALSVLTLWTG